MSKDIMQLQFDINKNIQDQIDIIMVLINEQSKEIENLKSKCNELEQLIKENGSH